MKTQTTTSTIQFSTSASAVAVGFVKTEKIICPDCGKKINRDAYPFHMRAIHAIEVVK